MLACNIILSIYRVHWNLRHRSSAWFWRPLANYRAIWTKDADCHHVNWVTTALVRKLWMCNWLKRNWKSNSSGIFPLTQMTTMLWKDWQMAYRMATLTERVEAVTSGHGILWGKKILKNKQTIHRLIHTYFYHPTEARTHSNCIRKIKINRKSIHILIGSLHWTLSITRNEFK